MGSLRQAVVDTPVDGTITIYVPGHDSRAFNIGSPVPPQPVVTIDQRGFARPSGPVCDIGAFELRQPTPSVAAAPAPISTPAKKKCKKRSPRRGKRKKKRKSVAAAKKKCKHSPRRGKKRQKK